MSGWFKTADDMTMAAPGAGIDPFMGKAPAIEKEEIKTADQVAKDLKALISSEISMDGEGEKRDVKALEDALKKVEEYIKDEKKEKERRDKEKEKEMEKLKKEQEKAKKNEPKGE